MRLLEIIFVCLLALDAFLLLGLGSRSRVTRWTLVAVFCVLGFHAFLERPHWQMGPAYLGAFLLLIAILLGGSGWARWLAGCAGLTLLLATIVLSYALPMFTLPRPTGQYRVGTSRFFLTDPNRNEDPENGGGKREVVVQAWYPADCGHRHLAPYRRWKETTMLSSYQSIIWTHSCEDGTVAANGAPFPVLIFDPSMNGRRTQTTFLMEELASHGFVIFSLDHPYNSGPMELASGKVLQIPPNPFLPLGTVGFDGFYRVVNKEVVKQTADTIFVLDTIARWNKVSTPDPSNIFYQRLDLGRIGMLGDSLGGSVAAETAVLDPRIRAVFSMSGPFFATARQKGVTVPFFEIAEPTPLKSEAELARLDADGRVDGEIDKADMHNLFSNLSLHGGFYAEIEGANHSSFTDKPFFSPLLRLGGEVPAVALRRAEIVRQYALAFFSETLKSQPAPLLHQEPSPFSELQLRQFTPAAPK